MGNQQAHRAVNEQVASAGRGGDGPGCGDGRGGRARRWLRRRLRAAACGARVATKTDRLDAWREERSSRQVFE